MVNKLFTWHIIILKPVIDSAEVSYPIFLIYFECVTNADKMRLILCTWLKLTGVKFTISHMMVVKVVKLKNPKGSYSNLTTVKKYQMENFGFQTFGFIIEPKIIKINNYDFTKI